MVITVDIDKRFLAFFIGCDDKELLLTEMPQSINLTCLHHNILYTCCQWECACERMELIR